MYPAITPLDVMPYLIFALPWFIAVGEIRNALRFGKMKEHLRRGVGVETNEDNTRVCSKEDEPRSYWFLLCFYILIVLAVPILMVGTILSKLGYI